MRKCPNCKLQVSRLHSHLYSRKCEALKFVSRLPPNFAHIHWAWGKFLRGQGYKTYLGPGYTRIVSRNGNPYGSSLLVSGYFVDGSLKSFIQASAGLLPRKRMREILSSDSPLEKFREYWSLLSLGDESLTGEAHPEKFLENLLTVGIKTKRCKTRRNYV